MPITQFTTTPLSTEPTNFSPRMDTRIVEQQTFITEANAMAVEMNLYAAAGPGAALAPSGFKNKIIGGDFTLNPWQRGTSFAAAVSGAYHADRWVYNVVGTAVHTITKALDAPTALAAGLFTQHCLSVAATTADAAIAIGDLCNIQQRIEGFNALTMGFGQAGARSITLSFWVKGAKTGVHCVSFRNSAVNRSYVAQYSIVAINTWEFKSITLSVDTTGTWLYDAGIGLSISFALAAGTTFQTTVNTWAAGNFFATSAQVNELDAVGNTFKLALVQLEANAIATEFESRSVGQELTLCQRYTANMTDLQSGGYAGAAGAFTTNMIKTPTTMRAIPTATASTIVYTNGSALGVNPTSGDTARTSMTAAAAGNSLANYDALFVAEI